MKKMLDKLRRWLIHKLGGYTEAPILSIPHIVEHRYNLTPITLRAKRILTVEEIMSLHDENHRAWMTQAIITNLKRQIIDAILKSGTLRLRHNEELNEFEASVLVVRDEERPEWM